MSLILKRWFNIMGVLILVTLCSMNIHETKQIKKSLLSISALHEPLSLDPHHLNDLNDSSVLHYLYEGLFRYGEHNELIPALAESLILSPDLCTYVFTLKKTTWSNGDPLLAQDIVNSWKRCILNAKNEPIHYMDCIQGASAFRKGRTKWRTVGLYALDKRTLEVTLERPLAYFLHALTLPSFFPVYLKKKDFFSAFNGRYILEEWNIHTSMRLKKNPFYWDHSYRAVQRIEFLFLNQETAFSLLCNGKIVDSLHPFTTKLIIPSLISKKKHTIKSRFVLVFHPKHPLMQSMPLREALSLSLIAMNSEEFVLSQHSLCPFASFLTSHARNAKMIQVMAQKKLELALTELSLHTENMPSITIGITEEIPEELALRIKNHWQETLLISVKITEKSNAMLMLCPWEKELSHPSKFLNPASLYKMYRRLHYPLLKFTEETEHLWDESYARKIFSEYWIIPFEGESTHFFRKDSVRNVYISPYLFQNFTTAILEPS